MKELKSVISLIFFNIKIRGKRQGWKPQSQDQIGKPLDYPDMVMKPKQLDKTHKEMGITEIFAYSLSGKSNRINPKNPNQNYLHKDYIEINCSDKNKAIEINEKIRISNNKLLDELFDFYINKE
jgi:hypothetical protein